MLFRHPQVMEAAVVARADPKWGESPCAFVTLKPDAQPTTAEDIIAFCRANMAPLQDPAHGGVRSAAQDLDRQDPEVRVARAGEGFVAQRFIVRQLLKFTPSKTDDAANLLSASREIRGTIQLQTREGTVAKGDAAMLGGVLDLRELQVLDIMIHRTKMTTVNADDPPQAIIDAILSSQYTRMPVWKSEPDNIVGILHTKDLLAALNRSGWKPDDIKIMGLATSPWFVPDTTSVQAQLNQFLKRKTQLALVVDEYGEVSLNPA